MSNRLPDTHQANPVSVVVTRVAVNDFIKGVTGEYLRVTKVQALNGKVLLATDDGGAYSLPPDNIIGVYQPRVINPVTFEDRITAGCYYSTLRGRDQKGYEARQHDQARLYKEFRRDLEAEVCKITLSEDVKTKMWEKAWTDGNDDNLHRVFYHYTEIYEIVKATMDYAGSLCRVE